MPMSDDPAAPAIRSLVAEIVSSYVKKNQIAPADIPALISTVHQSLLAAGKASEAEPERSPAVPIRQSVRPNYVVCLELRSAGQNAASAPSGRARAECGTVPPEMETCARLPTRRPGLFRAAICISKEVRIGSRGKRTKAARAEATDNLNTRPIFAAPSAR